MKKLDPLTDIDILLITEKGGICHAIHGYAKASNNYMKDYDKGKNLRILTNAA